ncbi:WD40 repeat-like protein [Rozella allomycis CSF55]|uniref:WD40 repeat-like protein n=1 Tax=Rozella allomycis (strain CSF55) TaxID=988480 RepID=A0A075B1Y4_ROZAC|nr:hypothetical protein O9G_002411 [Rozella allomycis CSF55]RKP21250.1 WD40 repeat-like protein [Rozella allomycis CSF55]|eukprot:EPZ34813.1 hypothetical protein O9G_002411 [Rozella allomycis CSF55]
MTTSSKSYDQVEFLRPIAKKHVLRTSIQHWQLRDLITCPGNKKEIYYVNQNNVNCYNTETKQIIPFLKDLAFSPTSITSNHGYLAVGGQRSQLVVKQLSSSWQASTSVGGSINNALCISQHLNDTRVLISNNDETIKVYSLPSLARITDITLPTAVNYASVSPDGKKMIAVGDSNHVYMYDITETSGYRRVGTFTGSTEAGFNCAWSQNSDKFAVACQDGFVCVWDIRSSEKLAKIQSQQSPAVKGACRSVKFSPSGSVDLLVFSEKHVSYINVVDARSFNQHQVLRVAPPNTDLHITGLSFSPDSQAVFVGTESAILEYEVDTILRRTFPYGAIL